jgi:hypothetical protein
MGFSPTLSKKENNKQQKLVIFWHFVIKVAGKMRC